GAFLAPGGEVALEPGEAVELDPEGVDPPFPLLGRGHRPGRGRGAPRRLHGRNGVLLDVGRAGLFDPPGPAPLVDVTSGGEPLQRSGLLGEARTGVVPRGQETLVPGDDKPPLA